TRSGMLVALPGPSGSIGGLRLQTEIHVHPPALGVPGDDDRVERMAGARAFAIRLPVKILADPVEHGVVDREHDLRRGPPSDAHVRLARDLDPDHVAPASFDGAFHLMKCHLALSFRIRPVARLPGGTPTAATTAEQVCHVSRPGPGRATGATPGAGV